MSIKKLNVRRLAEICKIPGAPGFEKGIRDHVKSLVAPYCDDLYEDGMGNLIALKKGKSSAKRAMVAAHMDEIGFIVKHIDEKGFIFFHPLGGFDPKTLTAQRVIIHGKEDVIGVMGSKPIHVMSPEERGKAPKLSDFFIDTGLPSENVHKLISVGDAITRERDLITMGDCINCKSVDNRVSVFALVEALEKLNGQVVPYDVYGVFTVQEEVGLRGALVAAHHINPSFSFGLDTTIAYDLPGALPHEYVTAMGKGVAIKVMDTSAISDRRMVAFMKSVCEKAGLTYQLEILTGGGTDTAGMQRMATDGTIAGAISFPTRHIHQVIEMAHSGDILGGIDLLVEALKSLDTWDWTA